MITSLRRQRNALPLLISILLAPLLLNLLSSWLLVRWGPDPSLLLLLLSGAILFLTILWLVIRWMTRDRPQPPVAHERQPSRYVGLIVLVGTEREGSARKPVHEVAIDYHLGERKTQSKSSSVLPATSATSLQRCWLIATSGPYPYGSVATAERTRQKYLGRCQLEICEVRDPFDVVETYHRVSEVYFNAQKNPELPLRPSQIITDITGGTSAMSAGAALAARPYGFMEYVQGGTKEALSMPVLIQFDEDE